MKRLLTILLTMIMIGTAAAEVPGTAAAPVPTAAPAQAATRVPTGMPDPTETPAITAEPTRTPIPREGPVYTLPIDLSPGKKLKKANYIHDLHYKDPTIEMIASQSWDGNVKYWIARVSIGHASQIRTMPAYSFTSTSTAEGARLSKRANAVLACNGDYFWKDVTWKGNYVLRQGELYMQELTGRSDILLIDEEGDFHAVHKAKPGDVPETVNGRKILNALCFGPMLVENGEICALERDDNIVSEQRVGRMAICQMGPLEYAVICCAPQSMTLAEFAVLVKKLGAVNAYNLDGGNSSMMFTGSRMINHNRTTREIGDIIYFASAWPEEENP